jgi:hypothetical protein
MRMNPWRDLHPLLAWPLLVAVLVLPVPCPAAAQQAMPRSDEESAPEGRALDAGKLLITQRGRKLRVEEFALQRLSDTLLVRAASQGFSEPGMPAHPVDKVSVLMVGMDYAMGNYWSTLAAGSDTLKRGITMSGADTCYTEWRELNKQGTAKVKVVPPGRIYVLDPPLFTAFVVIGHSLQGKPCEHRPIQVIVLGDRDSIVTATVNEVGQETIRWGSRPVVARKLAISDQNTTFTAWVATDGRLLRLEQPKAELLVERIAPPVKRRPQH